jgi:flagellar biosynthesis/type III secretory pathway protein FliH
MAAVPPMPPQQGHGAGWWVGVIAAATAVAVLLVLGGFFLGRGTRLSDDSVQTKINQQRQADQISQQRVLDAQAATMRKERAAAVKLASDRARARGIRQGRSEGHQQGFVEGQDQGFNNGQSSGYAQGQNDGFNSGLDTGSCLANSNFC